MSAVAKRLGRPMVAIVAARVAPLHVQHLGLEWYVDVLLSLRLPGSVVFVLWQSINVVAVESGGMRCACNSSVVVTLAVGWVGAG